MKYPKSEPAIEGRAITGARTTRDPRSRRVEEDHNKYRSLGVRPSWLNFMTKRVMQP
jgi:hypothetical protein